MHRTSFLDNLAINKKRGKMKTHHKKALKPSKNPKNTYKPVFDNNQIVHLT